ncbi:RNA 2',3'-cyclic phosphodiesterase [Geobacter pelophilus]|uniref:RNA 2',3'-cyclic phosphodiesterase n=1 Tax=Geoanaerobacter pelophilus TaxID=60036 RepID=A0AAW4L614_9BACT|nr:RNA 2',3'-cyclic phosphodiesterase [Geoanaerobacter pelophilus]MBT0664970.1 RNA 2',3'-cyclic phosphodiesterase [Geoanaerobacter pelophilus]
MGRLFVAIDLPEEVRRTICRLQEETLGFKWVPEEQLHLTLRFVGDADNEQYQQLSQNLAAINSDAFTFTLKALGHFPHHGPPRILWIGIDRCPDLMALQREVEAACVTAGFAADQRPFSPHITIARLKDASIAEVKSFAARHSLFRSAMCAVNSFHLYASTLLPKGAVHQRLNSFPLPTRSA